MAKFSLARVPYYIAVAVFMALVAIVSYVNNTKSTGLASDFYLIAMIVSAALGAISVVYLFMSQAGEDDEVGVMVGSLPFGKAYYYLGVLAIAVWRIIVGFVMNHHATGVASTYGVFWLLAGVGIALFTWANYRSYSAKNPNADWLHRG
jgi:hypothetical protein